MIKSQPTASLMGACLSFGTWVMAAEARSPVVQPPSFTPDTLPQYQSAATQAELLRTAPLQTQIPPNPNQDRFLQDPPAEPLAPLPATEPRLTPEFPTDSPPRSLDQTPLTFRKIDIVGSTVFTDADFAPLITPILGQPTTLEELNQVVGAITQLYIDAGYLTSRAILPPQAIREGAVTIQIIEGILSQVNINGLRNLNTAYVESRLHRGIGIPLNVNALEAQLRLLQLDPNLADFTVTLQSGEQLGSSVLVLDIQESETFFGDVLIDNASAASVGSTRSGIELGYRNLLGRGDVANLSYYQTFAGGSDVWSLAYTVPLNSLNGTLKAALTIDRNRIIKDPFDLLNIRGESELYELSFRQPLVRTATTEFALSLGFNHRTGQTFLFDTIGQPFSPGAEADGTTKTSVLRFGQDYTHRSRQGAWTVRSQFSLGTALLDATTNAGAVPDGQFFAWLGQVARVQRLSDEHLLIIQGDMQLADTSLLASESFGLGGAQTLRGYRQGARNADNGWRLSIEDRITIFEQPDADKFIQIAPFLDVGMVWNNASNPNQITDEYLLAGVGTGIIVQPEKNLTLRLDVAVPLVHVRDRQDDLQDDGLYFRILYLF